MTPVLTPTLTPRAADALRTAASLLLERGVNPRVVSEMLGHSSVGFTLDVYRHVTERMTKQAANVMDDLFGLAAT